MNIGEKVKKCRISAGMTQKNLSKLAEISTSYLCDIEVGRTNPSLKTLVKLSEALKIEIRELL